MINFRFFKTSILCGIFLIFTAGCRTPVITSPSGDTTIDAGDSISFCAETYPNAIYKWTFDGGAKDALGQDPTVQFNKAGEYYVFLTVVFEDFDSGFDVLKITVNGPDPRFTDNLDGTVTDNLTGLMWLKNTNCIKTNYPGFDIDGTAGDGGVTWNHALLFVGGINNGTYSNCACGYTDWRLPHIKELLSLVSEGGPCLPNGAPFTNVNWRDYWSSTTSASNANYAWNVDMSWVQPDIDPKAYSHCVWPVRDGH